MGELNALKQVYINSVSKQMLPKDFPASIDVESASADYNRLIQKLKRKIWPKSFDKTDLTMTVFPSLEGYQVAATNVSESKYPWIAQVIHSRDNNYPHICTCSCIDRFIFITSARCLYTLRLIYTTVLYHDHRFPAKAFVTPSNTTKQSFDDIGFIVVLTNNSYGGSWDTVQVYNTPRTDDAFQWFSDYIEKRGSSKHVAIGWTITKQIYKVKKPKTQYYLTELDIVLGIDLCAQIYTVNFKIKGFYVPCYFGCTLKEFETKSDNCKKAHGAEGGAIYNKETKELFGIATWGSYFAYYELPLGFSVPNSKNYYADLECAKKIRDDTTEDIKPNYLQSLCPD